MSYRYTSLVLSFLILTFTSVSATANTQSDPLTECYKSIKDQPRTTIEICLQPIFKLSEKNLNSAYNENKHDIEGIDSVSTKRALESLRRSQDDFIQFRNSECQRRADAMMGGTGSGDELLACQIELNKWRTKILLGA